MVVKSNTIMINIYYRNFLFSVETSIHVTFCKNTIYRESAHYMKSVRIQSFSSLYSVRIQE